MPLSTARTYSPPPANWRPPTFRIEEYSISDLRLILALALPSRTRRGPSVDEPNEKRITIFRLRLPPRRHGYPRLSVLVNLERKFPRLTPSHAIATYTMLLHNWAQQNRRLNSLVWEDVATGTNPNLTWTSVVKMDGKALGSGSGARKKQARGLAARQALVSLGIVDDIPPDE